MPLRDHSPRWFDPHGLPAGPATEPAWRDACDNLATLGADLPDGAVEVYELRTAGFQAPSDTEGRVCAEAGAVAVLPDGVQTLLALAAPADDVAGLALIWSDQCAIVVTRTGATYQSRASDQSPHRAAAAIGAELAAHLLAAPRPAARLTVPDWLARTCLAVATPAIGALYTHADAQPWLVEHATKLAPLPDARHEHTRADSDQHRYLSSMVTAIVAAAVAKATTVLTGRTLSASVATQLNTIATMAFATEPDLAALAGPCADAAQLTFAQAWDLDPARRLWEPLAAGHLERWDVELAARVHQLLIPTQPQSLAAIARVGGTDASRAAAAVIAATGWSTGATHSSEGR